MITTERNILNTVVSNLKNSTKTNWATGDIQDFKRLAILMEQEIKSSTDILITLVSEEKNPIKD